MKKNLLAVIFMLALAGCGASNVEELRESGEHYTFYANDSLQNVYNNAIKKYNECGIPISNQFIDTNTGNAGISYRDQKLGLLSHADMKEEKKQKTRVDVYCVSTFGGFAHFMKMTKYATENKEGCPSIFNNE